MFVEMSPSLAKAKGIKPGDWVKVKDDSGRSPGPGRCHPPGGPFHLRPTRPAKHGGDGGPALALRLRGLCHRGTGPPAGGPAVNQLTPMVGDANTQTPEYKVFLVDIVKA